MDYLSRRSPSSFNQENKSSLHEMTEDRGTDAGAGGDSWESLGQQGNQTSQSEGNQPWTLIGRTDAEAEALRLWPPDVKSRLTGKDPDAGKYWRQEEMGVTDAGKDWGQEKRVTEDEMAGWHHQLNGHEFDNEGQGSLACCRPRGRKELNRT